MSTDTPSHSHPPLRHSQETLPGNNNKYTAGIEYTSWTKKKAVTMENLFRIVKQYWGFDRLLPLQKEAMTSVLNHRDSVVILPTGGGKSLCFQAPAMAMNGIAVVISPLISLMKDQVDALRANGVPAAKIDSAMSGAERLKVHQEIQSGNLKLLYVSPERIVQENFAVYLKNAGISFLVIDEAHCISHWGHDFRPEYRALKALRNIFPDVAVHAYTATPQVRDDIIQELDLRQPEILLGSFDRPNLCYRVLRRAKGDEKIKEIIRAHPGDAGIVYCIRRSDVDNLCRTLHQEGWSALPYHAGMDDNSRKQNQDAFANESADIIVATVAFGMGIDKSNVRYIIHAAMPKSIEHYQQETGRAGRDGLEAECWLLYSYADYKLWQSILNKSESGGADVALAKLNDMFQFCERKTCRHKALVTYFGERYPEQPCGACDICLGHFDSVENSKDLIQHILSGVALLGDFAGPTYTTLVLTGADEDRVRVKKHHLLPCFGSFAAFNANTVRDWLEQLVQQDFLCKSGPYNVLSLTDKGLAAQGGDHSAYLARPVGMSETTRGKNKSKAPALSDLNPYEMELFDALRRLRREKAEELNLPPFIIFSDAALRDMALRKPTDRIRFMAIHGVGLKKCEAFGDEFLARIQSFCPQQPNVNPEQSVPSPDPDETTMPPKRLSRREIQAQADTLFSEGKSIQEVADTLGRKPSTTLDYLLCYISEHNIADPSPWVDPQTARYIQEIAELSPDQRLKSIDEKLGGHGAYTDIRISLACMRNKNNMPSP